MGSDKVISGVAKDMTDEERSDIDKAVVSIKISAKRI